MSCSDIELPSPAWRLKELVPLESGRMWVIFQYATFRTNEELMIWQREDGGYAAQLTGSEGKVVTDRLPQEQWAALYQKAIAARALTGKKVPTIVEEIF